MTFPEKRLLLAAALGLPLMLAGCQSRAELISSASAESPTRTVTADSAAAEAPAEEDVADEQTAEASQSVSLSGPEGTSSRTTLESAGGVIEFDEQGRAVGVDLTKVRVTPEVSRSIAALSGLQWADFRGTDLSDADLAVICALPRFELLALGQTQITDAGLQHLRQQHRLRFLSLDGTAVTDAGISTLAALPRLEGLSLSKTAVSRQAARRFENQNPACRVILDLDAPDDSSQQSTSPQGPADLPQDSIDRSEPAGLPTSRLHHPAGESQVALNNTLDTFDWPQQTPAAPQRSAAQPAAGESTLQAGQDDAWFLDASQAAVFPQSLPKSPDAQANGEPALQPTEPTVAVHPAAGPQIAARQTSVQITPLNATPVTAAASSPEETARQLNQVLQQRLLDEEVLTALSRHLLAQQEYAKAVRALEALSALQPDNPQVRFDLGVALGRSGLYDQAHPHLATIVGDATAWYNLGVIAFERDEPQHSERFFGRAIDLAPDFSEARIWLVRVRRNSETTATPSAQAADEFDGRDLVDLLMSEFGHAGTSDGAAAAPTPNRSAAGITIVPAK